MIVEKAELQEILNQIQESSESLINIINDALEKSICPYTDNQNPDVEIPDMVKRMASDLKHFADSLLKLKPVKR